MFILDCSATTTTPTTKAVTTGARNLMAFAAKKTSSIDTPRIGFIRVDEKIFTPKVSNTPASIAIITACGMVCISLLKMPVYPIIMRIIEATK